ncbi:MAG: RNA polymerase sigma factor [Bacteroidota bacterium]
MHDEELMRRSVNGCEQSFAEIYDRYGQRMHSYFYRMLWQDAQLAEDFTQDLFLKIIEKRNYYNPEKKFSTWLYTVAGNMVKNEYRRVSRKKPLPEMTDVLEENFSEKMDQVVFETHLNNALNSLDDLQKQCFVLRYQEEKSMKEIAEIIGCPEGTVKSRLFYTVRKLANKLRAFAGVL